jgi:ElaB/YqjD/DUF883 family membrane-anchored ribosome-binding protein
VDFKDKLNKAWDKTKEVAGEVGKGAKEGYEKAKEQAPGAWEKAKADMKHAAGAAKSEIDKLGKPKDAQGGAAASTPEKIKEADKPAGS